MGKKNHKKIIKNHKKNILSITREEEGDRRGRGRGGGEANVRESRIIETKTNEIEIRCQHLQLMHVLSMDGRPVRVTYWS